jgi:hypothetical protein
MAKITLSIPSLPSLVLSKIPGGTDDFSLKSSVEPIGFGERSITGTDTIQGSGIQYFVWSIQTIVSWDELMLFDAIKAWQQDKYTTGIDGAILLTDEKEYVVTTEALRGNRSVIDTKATSWGGLAHFISCPVFLRVPEHYWQKWASDLYLLQFDAKELTR